MTQRFRPFSLRSALLLAAAAAPVAASAAGQTAQERLWQEQWKARVESTAPMTDTGRMEQHEMAAPAVDSMHYYLVQIAAFSSANASVDAYWEGFKGRHPSVTAGKKVYLENLPGGGHKLRFGPFASMDEARSACQSIRSAGGDCFPVKP